MTRQPVAGGGNLLQVVLQVTPIVRRLLRVAVLHDQDAPAVPGGRQQGPHRHGRLRQVREQSAARRVSGAQVPATAAPAERQLGQVGGAGVGEGAAVVVVDAAGGGPPQAVVVLKVFRQVDQVSRGRSRGGAPQSAQLVVGRLEDLLEHGGVKVLAPEDVLFTRLLDLDDDGDDQEDEDDAASDADYGPVCVVQVVEDVGFPLLCTLVKKKKKHHNKKATSMRLLTAGFEMLRKT